MNQAQRILTQMEIDNAPQNWFSLKEIYTWLWDHRQFGYALSPDADYPYWSPDYTASIFHNSTMRGKTPKIERMKINNLFHYHMKPIKS